MADKLETEIEKARTDYWAAEDVVAEAERKRDVAIARLEALELAATLRPLGERSPLRIHREYVMVADSPPSGTKGRQPGAISKQWRSILLKLAQDYPQGAPENEILEVAKSAGLPNIRSKDVRDRMADYTEHGYVERHPLNGWVVTELALKRFGGATDDSDANVADEPKEQPVGVDPAVAEAAG